MLRSSTTSCYQEDGLGSVTSLSNGSGALAQTYTFDSFGKQTASTGSFVNPFQYTGRESDSETGLYYYRARYHDPASGRPFECAHRIINPAIHHEDCFVNQSLLQRFLLYLVVFALVEFYEFNHVAATRGSLCSQQRRRFAGSFRFFQSLRSVSSSRVELVIRQQSSVLSVNLMRT